jgi:hypothetical protein
MVKNSRAVQYVRKEEAEALFETLEKCDPLYGIIGCKHGAKTGPCGEYNYYGLPKQAYNVGLECCDKFEGYTLIFSRGELRLVKAEPTDVVYGSVERWSRVYF